MDVTLANFEQEVLLASRELPVVVQFWSARSPACQTLAQTLDKLAAEFAGRFKLVRVDADQNPELVQHFRLRSLPFVVAFVGAQPADALNGAVDDAKARAFIERLLPNPAEIAYRNALMAREAGDAAAAEQHLRQTLTLEPAFDDARYDYIELLLANGRFEDAQAHYGRITPQGAADPRHESIGRILAAREQAEDLPDESELLARIQASPDDLEARLELANKRIARSAWKGAMDELLEIVRRDRGFQDDIGRKTLIAVFDMASAQPELVSQMRRKLSSMLF